MSSRRTKPDSECQSCRGTGYVAGAQPIKTGPYLLEPPPCRVCGGTGRTPQPSFIAFVKRLRCTERRRKRHGEAACTIGRRTKPPGAARLAVSPTNQPPRPRVGTPWSVLPSPATMPCPERAGAGDEKALQSRRQTGESATPQCAEAKGPQCRQRCARSPFIRCRPDRGRAAYPRAGRRLEARDSH
jgi:hypothetical protein